MEWNLLPINEETILQNPDLHLEGHGPDTVCVRDKASAGMPTAARL
jgi:hypothetical protein